MEYTHNRKNLVIRIVYYCLLACGILSFNIGEGIFKPIISSLSLISLVVSVYLIVRYELTTFTYVIRARDSDFDFFVNKAVGRRGNYICYYYASDIVKIVKYSKEAKEQLKAEFPRYGYYSFCNNFMNDDKYIVVFKNVDYYDFIVIEMDDSFKKYIEACKLTAVATSKPKSLNEDDEDNEEAVASDTKEAEAIVSANTSDSEANSKDSEV